MFLQSSSLAAVSPGNKTLQALVDSVVHQLQQLAASQGVAFNGSVVYQGILVALDQSPRVNADQVLDLIAQDGDLADLILSGQILTVSLKSANQTLADPGGAGLHTSLKESRPSGQMSGSMSSNDTDVSDASGALGSTDPYVVKSGDGNSTTMSVLAGTAPFVDSTKGSVAGAFGSDASTGSGANTAAAKILSTPASSALLSVSEQSNR